MSTGVVVVEPNATASIDLTISAAADAASGDTSLAGVKVYAQSAELVAGGDSGIDDIPVLTVPVAVAPAAATAQAAFYTPSSAPQR